MIAEGKVVIDLRRPCGDPVGMSYSPPGDIGALLKGRTPGEALGILSAMFSVCGIAQAHAAAMALEAAQRIAVSPETAAARQALTAMETLREQMLRLALDWPRLAGESAPSAEAARSALQLVPQLAAALFGAAPAFAIGGNAKGDKARALEIIDAAEALLIREVFDEPLDVWLARRGRNGLLGWAESVSTMAGRMMTHLAERSRLEAAEDAIFALPPLSDETLAAWLADGVAELPLAGCAQTPETTVYSRRRTDPLIASLGCPGLGARFAARLVELADLPGEMRVLISGDGQTVYGRYIGDGAGVGAVEAARGLLIHAASIEGGRIVAYRILPPTRWNFDAQGVAARCLSGIEDFDLVHLVVNAIDPCVAYEVRAD